MKYCTGDWAVLESLPRYTIIELTLAKGNVKDQEC